ncbi:hypothetical protein G9A89_005758 [Geosiphon pyriformis]|nr:hypothetical protein G9A89_005758 [Geosiphon pyriformis]
MLIPGKRPRNKEKNWENSWKDTSTIDTIESLSIIQRTQPKPSDPLKPSDTTPSDYDQLLLALSTKLQRTSTDNTKPKVAESETIRANHLGFAKFLFQHYCQYLGLNHNHISAESAFNFYVNEKISSLLGTPVNTESAKKTFYRELIQNTNLPTNHNFVSIITEINKEIEHHTQQRYPITYANKGKRKLQTPAVTPRKIQPPAWKKNRVESPSNPSYHYTPGSAINISSTDTFTSTATSAFGRFPFQNFGISDPWEAAESEKKKEKSEDQEFTYQHPITENPEQQLENLEIETPNIRTLPNQRNQGPELINQQNLPPVIIINQPPINPIAELIQQPLQLPPQQPGQQQLLQQPPQPPNLDPMVYAPIAKLDNFTGEENDAQIWLNDSLINKPQDFNALKVEFLRYFSNNNSINRLVNAFTTIKQEETEAVTTYLKCFHRNLRQIQAIDVNYFTAPQILNQFICGLRSSILQHVRLLHPGMLQDAVTRTRDFESAESEANHAQTINLVMNGSSELDSKLEKFSNPRSKVTQNWRLVIVVHQPIPSSLNSPSGSCTWNLDTSRVQNPNSQHYLSLLVTPENTTSNNTESNQHIPTNTILLAIISSDKSLAAIFLFELEENTTIPLFSELVLEEKPITAMYTDARVDGHPIKLILDSGSAGSIITRQLMDQLGRRVDQAASAKIITADGVTKTPIGEINDFPFEVNGIITSIKVLVMEATQYQALVGNDWLSKANATLDWNTQELQLTYQDQHIRVLATCGHFKTPPREKLLIKLEEEKKKPTWEAYQVSWADKEHNKLPPILSWDNNNKEKGKQKEELTWKTDDLT